MKIDISEDERELVGRLLDARWHTFDQLRMTTRPGSFEEREYLEEQQEIEILQTKLRHPVTTNR